MTAFTYLVMARVMCILILTTLAKMGVAQDRVNHYFVQNGRDTVLCKSLVWRPIEKKRRLSYVRWGGEVEETMDKEGFESVTTLFMDGYVHERIPRRPGQPDGATHFAQRIANGKLKLYTREVAASDNSGRSLDRIFLVLRTAEGEYLNVVDAELRKKLNPLLERCKAYRAAYPEAFDWHPGKDWEPQVTDLTQRVNTYNANCP